MTITRGTLRIGALAACLALPLAGCANQNGDYTLNKQTVGAAVGAVTGAVVGNQFGSGSGRTVATLAGGLAGLWVGSSIGKQIDERDRQLAASATSNALNANTAGQSTSWNNPNTGNAGAVTPQNAYTDPSGKTCRKFEQTLNTGGQQEISYGTACKQPDGSWRIV